MKTQETAQTLPFEYGKPAIPAYLRAANSKYKSCMKNGKPIDSTIRTYYNRYMRWQNNMNVNPNTVMLPLNAKRAIKAFGNYLNDGGADVEKAMELYKNVTEEIARSLMDAPDGADGAVFVQLKHGYTEYRRLLIQRKPIPENIRNLSSKYRQVLCIRKKFIRLITHYTKINAINQKNPRRLFLRCEYVKSEMLRMNGHAIPKDTQMHRDEYVSYWDKKLELMTMHEKMRSRSIFPKRTRMPNSLKKIAMEYFAAKKAGIPATDDMQEGFREYTALRQNRTFMEAFKQSQKHNANKIRFDEETVSALREANEEYNRRKNADEYIDDDLVWAQNTYIQWCFGLV